MSCLCGVLSWYFHSSSDEINTGTHKHAPPPHFHTHMNNALGLSQNCANLLIYMCANEKMGNELSVARQVVRRVTTSDPTRPGYTPLYTEYKGRKKRWNSAETCVPSETCEIKLCSSAAVLFSLFILNLYRTTMTPCQIHPPQASGLTPLHRRHLEQPSP